MNPTVLAIGNFNPEGSRHWVIREGLKTHEINVIDCPTNAKGLVAQYKALKNLYRMHAHTCTHVLAPFQSHHLVPMLWWMTRRPRKPLVFDVFVSQYDTMVHDRKLLSRWHPKATLLRLLDRWSCRLADAVLIDTEEHKKYFVDTFGIDPEKMIVVPIGARTDVFRPLAGKRTHAVPRAAFHGMFIPLQGVDTILQAASILQQKKVEVEFVFYGKGQTFPQAQKLAKELELQNAHFAGTVPMEELPGLLAEADVCLGIFGTSGKAQRVVPHKAYEVLACARPLITARTPAAERFFQSGVHALLTAPGDPAALADAIAMLIADARKRDAMAEAGHRLFQKHFCRRK